MTRRIITILILNFITLASIAQTKLKGKIVDAENNNPLAGATITGVGATGTTSDNEGNFSFDCSKATSITITHVGYELRKLTIKNCDEVLNIRLSPTAGTLGEVEVTATSNSNKSLLYQPASISKLTPVELKRGVGLFLDDAINANIPGVSMQRRSVAAGQQFNLRGYGNGTRGTRGVSSNFDGQGYKVYLNGIPVTDAEGITLMDDIDFGSVANVEVTKGPAGTLYGLAIAGAVNLKTVKAVKGQTTLGQDILLGSYGLRRFTTHFSMGTEKSSILLNYGNQHVDGYMVHTRSDKQFVNFVGEFQPNAKQNISTYFGYTNSYDQRGGELTTTQYESKDYSVGNVDYIKRNGHSNVISYRAGVSHNYTFNNKFSNSTTVFGTGQNQNVSSAGGWTDKAPINIGLRSTFNTKFNLSPKISLSGITGIETQHQHANTIGYNMKQNPLDTTTNGWAIGKPYWVINATTSNVFTITNTTSEFTEWTLGLPKDLSFTAGLGFSNMKIYLQDRFNPATATKPSEFDTTYKNMVSPHFAVNKVFNKNFSVYASYSTGYKAPISAYFYIVTPVVASPATASTARLNSALKPERGSQFELGTKGSLLNSRLNYQLAYYHAVFSNKMTNVSVQLNSTTTAYSYVVNGGEQDHNGIEALLKYAVVKDGKGLIANVTPFLNFAYCDFKYKNFIYKSGSTTSNIITYDYSGLNVFGVPKIANTWGVDVGLNNGLYLNVYHLYKDGVNIGYETISNVNILRKASSYNLVNGKIGFRRSLNNHIDLDAFFGVDNITKTQYPYMVFANQLSDAYLPAPLKANAYGGVNVKYNF